MANFFKDWVFNQLPRVIQIGDTNKNSVGDGTLKRYLRTMGLDLDENLMLYLENFTNLFDILLVDDKFLPNLGGILGYPPAIVLGNNNLYRKILSYAVYIYKIKGTLKSFQILFNLLELSIEIHEEIPRKRITYDMHPLARYDEVPPNQYDSDCDHCSGYWIYWMPVNSECNNLRFLNQLSPEYLAAINNVICFLNPINAVFMGFVRNYNVCDTIGLRFADSTNFCDHPTNINITWSDLDGGSATLTWDDGGDTNFEIQYRLYPDGDFGASTMGGSPQTFTGLATPNILYEFRIRKLCSDSNSAWRSVFLLTGTGIVNVSGHDVFPSELIYKAPIQGTLIAQYSVFIDFTNPETILSLNYDDQVIPGPGLINNLDDLLTWLNTLNFPIFGSGNWFKDGDNAANIGAVLFKKIVTSFGDAIFNQEEVFVNSNGAAISNVDYYLDLDWSVPKIFTNIDVLLNTYGLPGTTIHNNAELVSLLNTFGTAGIWEVNGSVGIKSLANSDDPFEIKYHDEGSSDLIWVKFSARNIILTDTSLVTLLGDYGLYVDLTDPIYIDNLIINNTPVSGPLTPISTLTELIDWLNSLGKGLFIISGDGIASLDNPNTIYTLTYNITGNPADNIQVNFSQTSLRVTETDTVGTIITFAPGFVMHDGDVFTLLIPPGPYVFIRIVFPIDTNPIPLTGGVLYTPGAGPFLGYMDGNDLVFNDITLGASFEIVFL